MRADLDRQIPVQMKEEFIGAMNCNGNGLCFNFDVHSIMCPSMKVSKNRVFSPKGRAAMVREWLRLLANEQITPAQLDFKQSTVKLVWRVKLAPANARLKLTYRASARSSSIFTINVICAPSKIMWSLMWNMLRR